MVGFPSAKLRKNTGFANQCVFNLVSRGLHTFAVLVTAVTAFMHVQKIFLEFNACAQPSRNEDFVFCLERRAPLSLTENVLALAEYEIGALFRKTFV